MTSWTAQRITGKNFYETHYQKTTRETGKSPDLFDRIKYLHSNEMFKEDHIIVVTDTGLVVGNIATQVNPYDTTQLWIKHVSVDPAYHNKGVATVMVEELYALARDTQKSLQRGSPTQMGKDHLTEVFHRASARNPDVHVIPAPTY
jgi:GNAT superfamily N-acetyltransferase